MNEGYVKVSWENNAKTGAVENIAIDTEASAMEEATAACLMVRHACETIIAQNCGKEKEKNACWTRWHWRWMRRMKKSKRRPGRRAL